MAAGRDLDNPPPPDLVSGRHVISRGRCASSTGSWAVVAFVAALLAAGGAHAAKSKAGKAEEIREYLDKATAAFALNHFAEAAENYEKAFALKPDAAVLYNAAQAHRLANNKERALELYQSYLRLYGSDKRAEIEKHVENLKQAIEKDRAVATSPPTSPAPVGGAIADAPPPPAPAEPPPPPKPEPAPAAAVVPAAPPPAAQPAPALVAQASPPAEGGSVVSKPWFWIAVGAVVVGAVVTAVVVTRPGPSDPVGNLGDPVAGN